MANYCGKCGTPLPIDSDADACWRHGGPPLTADAQIRCPFCKEPIYAEAKKCRFCGEAMIVPEIYVPQILSPGQSMSDSELNPAKAYRAVQPKSRGGLGIWMRNHPLLTLAIVFSGLLFLAIVRLESVSESRSTGSMVSGDSVAQTKPVTPPTLPKPTEMDRFRFAMQMDQFLIDKGIESTTTATGPEFTTLQITYALAGRVMANEFQKNFDFDRLKQLGFKKIVLTNGDQSFMWPVF